MWRRYKWRRLSLREATFVPWQAITVISCLGWNVQGTRFSEKLAKPFPSTQLEVSRPGKLSGLLVTVKLLREEKSESKIGHPVGFVLCPPSLLHACEVSYVTFLPINHAQILSQLAFLCREMWKLRAGIYFSWAVEKKNPAKYFFKSVRHLKLK